MSWKIKALVKSPWAFHLSTGSCNNCDIEVIDIFTPRYDVERFGVLLAPSIRHADIIVVCGSMNRKSAKKLQELYAQAPKPVAVVAIGACACSNGMFRDSYNCGRPGDPREYKDDSKVLTVDSVVPVTAYIPGCPPKPEALILGIVKALQAVGKA